MTFKSIRDYVVGSILGWIVSIAFWHFFTPNIPFKKVIEIMLKCQFGFWF